MALKWIKTWQRKRQERLDDIALIAKLDKVNQVLWDLNNTCNSIAQGINQLCEIINKK